MSVTNIQTTTSMHGALSYQEKDDRAVYETASCEPLSFYDTAMSMLSDNKRRTIEALTIVQSFSPNELDYQNPDDILRAHQAGIALCAILHEKYHVMFNVVTHIDSKGHNVHNHIVIPNVDLETGKALQGEVKLHDNLVRINDELMRDLKLEVCNHPADGYDFKADLKNRLNEAINASQTYDDFVIEATKRGISIKDTKGNGQPLKHITYEFEDTHGVKHKIRDNKIDDVPKDDDTKIVYNRAYIEQQQYANLQQKYANLTPLDESLSPHDEQLSPTGMSL